MLSITKTKLLLIDLLLAVATDKRGLHDVLTGRVDGLEPPLEDGWGVLTFQHYVGAMEFGTVEGEDEEAVEWCWGHSHDCTYVLTTRKRKPRGDGQRHRSFWSR